MYESKYPIPALCSDAIILCDGKILLIKRKEEPFKGKWAFPGGHFNEYESARDCCIRETKEETGLDIEDYCPHLPYGDFGGKGRDPRGWVVSLPFVFNVDKDVMEKPIQASDDAEDVKWIPIDDILEGVIRLAFDHYKILSQLFHWKKSHWD